MRAADSPWQLADTRLERALLADREIRISDFALFALVPLRTVGALGYPLNELAGVAVIALALWRRPTSRPLSSLVWVLMVAVMGILLLSGLANDNDWTRRVGHMAIFMGLVWALGTGRTSLRSAAMGLGAGIAFTVAHGVVTLPASSYAGRLTGFLGDPNAGAYFIISLGLLAVGFASTDRRWRVALAAPILVGAVLVYSRTGLLALGFAVAWWLVGRRLGRLGGLAAVAGLVWISANTPESLKTWGPFSDRSGSDALRDRIVARERITIAEMPWYGNGPGSATVEVGEQTFFFHNSYLATRAEGGWVLLVLVLALVAVAFLALFAKAHRRHDFPATMIQASLISVLAMAVTLGEVLMDLPAAIAIGFALGHARRLGADGEAPDDDAPDDSWSAWRSPLPAVWRDQGQDRA